MKKGLVFSSIASLGVLIVGLTSVSAAWRFSDTLNTWASMDVFTYVLPFLLVFAVVFGILNKSKIFGDEAKGVNVIIALSLGLLSLVGGFVPTFFQKIFPNLAVGLSVLLVGIILLGLWMGSTDIGPKINIGMVIVGALIFLFVVYSSFSNNYTGLGGLWDQYGNALVALLILIGIIAMIVFWGKNK